VRVFPQFGQPEIKHLDPPVFAHHEIGGLEITVRNAFLMRRSNGVGQFNCNVEQTGQRHAAFRNQLRSGSSATAIVVHERHIDTRIPRTHYRGDQPEESP
jgi:hypothetical protein